MIGPATTAGPSRVRAPGARAADWPDGGCVGDHGRVRRLLATALLVLGLLLPALAGAGPALAQEGGGTEQTTTSLVPTQDIIPEPNSGREPEEAGDRGGALQTALFIGLVLAIGAGAALVVRQSRQARAQRGF